MNPLAIHPSLKASDVPLADLAANKHIPDSEKVAEVSRQFEAWPAPPDFAGNAQVLRQQLFHGGRHDFGNL